MRRIAVLDAPSNLGLRPPTATSVPGCAKAPGALRDQGLLRRLNARDAGCLTPPRYDPGDWRPGDGVAHAREINGYSRRLADRISAIIDQGEFPVILGGDCSIVLGSALAMHRLGESVGGRIGLVFVDGHSDFRHPGNASYVGAAAGEDLALVTGRGQADLAAMEGRRPYYRDIDVVVMGIRSHDEYRLDLQAAGIVTRPVPTLRAEGAARSAQWAREQLVDCAGYWVHLDVDVLDPAVLPAVDAPEPGGIAFPELEILLSGLVESPHCLGVEITVFDPDYDPDGTYAEEITSALVAGLQSAHTADARPDLIAARQALLASPETPGTLPPSTDSAPAVFAPAPAPAPVPAVAAAGPAVAVAAPAADPAAASASTPGEAEDAPGFAEGHPVSRDEDPPEPADPAASFAEFPEAGSSASPEADSSVPLEADSSVAPEVDSSVPPEVDSSVFLAAGSPGFLAAGSSGDAPYRHAGAFVVPHAVTDDGVVHLEAAGDLTPADEHEAGDERAVQNEEVAQAQFADPQAPEGDHAEDRSTDNPERTEGWTAGQPEHVRAWIDGQPEHAERWADGHPEVVEALTNRHEHAASLDGTQSTNADAEAEARDDQPDDVEADLSPEADLSVADLPEADLSEADPSEADLPDADLSEGGLSEADPSEVHLPEADLGEGGLGEADLSEAGLSEADLGEAGDGSEGDGSEGDRARAEAEPVEGDDEPAGPASLRPLGSAPLLDSRPLPATMPGMLRPRPVEEFSLPAQRPAFEIGPEEPADVT
ncbi:arginase/agmatinase/formiminoglutamase [Actinoplanes sp. N902-109]|nr:arginase/agmatinase/formiminoglutamase [Actinoplanes sp. N902-109]